MKKGALIGIGIGAALILVTVLLTIPQNNQTAPVAQVKPKFLITIAMSASRPGCETNGCYLPTELSVSKHDTVTWENDDRGFHTITTGHYDTPDGMFDSGQVPSSERFSYTFDKTGEFHYYCRLHPWMEGKIIVN